MESLNIGTGTAKIYGSFAGATGYFDTSGSSAADAFRALTDDNARKQKLVDATRFMNRLAYADGYTDFATRDALDLGTGDGEASFPFRAACYELAGLAADDPDVLTVEDQGTNVRSVAAGSARVELFNATSAARGTAPALPPTVMTLIGAYLAIGQDALAQDGGTGDTGSCSDPFGWRRNFDRRDPW